MELKQVDIRNLKPRIREFNNDTLYQAYTKCKSLWLIEIRKLINYDLIFAGVDLRYVLLDEDIDIILDMMLQEVQIRGFGDIEVFGKKTAGEWYGKYETLQELNANTQ